MNWAEILNSVFELVLIPLLGLITKYFIQFITMKVEEAKEKSSNDTFDKYLSQLNDAINRAVLATNQTYVDSLKDKNVFTAEAQKEAFEKTYATVLACLSTDAKTILAEGLGDLQTYITTTIEQQVLLNKKV